MEDDQKIQNGRKPKKLKIENDKKQFNMEDGKKSKWKMTKQIQNGRRPNKFKMEDDQTN